MQNVLIIVPLYRERFDQFEKAAWHQLQKVLGRYPICLVMPEKYHRVYSASFQNRIESFPNEFFLSTKTYSRLLLSPEFYRRFQTYEYILIYQLDAFVFSDWLCYFVSLGYDYIGAPLPKWSNYWFAMKTRPGKPYIPFRARVGNGGLSLRKIASMLRVLKRKEQILAAHPLSRMFQEQEDMFFSYCGTIPDGLRIPGISLAKKFSIEMDVGHCYRTLEKHLPFGCHAWHKINFPAWEKFIVAEGYHFTDKPNALRFERFRCNTLRRYLMERMCRERNLFRAKCAVREVLPKGDYAIWGMGQDGKFLLAFLLAMDINISGLFDLATKHRQTFHDITIQVPTSERLSPYKGRLLIGTTDGESAIRQELINRHSFCSSDFIGFTELLGRVVRAYYPKTEELSKGIWKNNCDLKCP